VSDIQADQKTAEKWKHNHDPLGLHKQDNKLLGLAKVQARIVTQEDPMPYTQLPRIKLTTLNIARSYQGTSKGLPEKVGKHVKRVDAALPGKHT
jgi:hypothetical protein